MRPLRLILLLALFVALPISLTFISLVTAHPRNGNGVASTSPPTSRLRALFSFQTPSSLFPPSAMISLTDDNTTFFIAKPADFGPRLPAKGLNGQLWVGVGFGDDVMREDGVLTSAEGELGCSDVPGWDGVSKKSHTVKPPNGDSRKSTKSDDKMGNEMSKANADNLMDPKLQPQEDMEDGQRLPDTNDGTDDHLHHPLPESGTPNVPDVGRSPAQDGSTEKGAATAHADIQSLQESAEIAGKVVLLRRGGCGFLEKIKWAQRRGAIAVVVGDNARHGSLLTMYARGDTSNITIPSVFTSHTTAHLLSSLMPPEAMDDGADTAKAAMQTLATDTNERPTVDSKDDGPSLNHGDGYDSVSTDAQARLSSATDESRQSWIRSLLNAVGLAEDVDAAEEDSRRPPSSGNIDWVLVEDFEDEDASSASARPKVGQDIKSSKITMESTKGSDMKGKHTGADDFIIGEQDWRDPDLLKPIHKSTDNAMPDSENDKQKVPDEDKHTDRLKGGSITPGSGEYIRPQSPPAGKHGKPKGSKAPPSRSGGQAGSKKGRFSWLAPSEEHKSKSATQNVPHRSIASSNKPNPIVSSLPRPTGKDGDHDGLWITLTPASMSTSPFLDTLLVLVVSPLVTLTVVYALLLLRSRIRRRRWRAPKSVVDRLPVRTYHTMSTSAVSSQLSSPDSSSPTTPLLRATASTRSRPRSRTASSLPTNSESAQAHITSGTPPEKRHPAPVWRRRYNGRQVECVVCLEEYVDGQSRVMSLPCGHEFHVECITPWLTTRRRTCPICKGDVVRSMAQMAQFSPSDEEISGRSDDIQDIAAESRNDSPSAAIPISRGEAEDEDLERAEDGTDVGSITDEQPIRRGWRSLLSFSALSDNLWAGRQTPVDRNR